MPKGGIEWLKYIDILEWVSEKDFQIFVSISAAT